MDLAIVTALSNLGGMGVLSAVLFFLLVRQMGMHDRHMTALVSKLGAISERLDALEADVAEVRSALGEPTRLRVFPCDTDPAA